MKSTREKVSYCIGLETGKGIKNQFSDIESPLLIQGFEDALNDAPTRLPSEEIQQVLTALRRQMELQQRQHITQLAENNKKQGEAFLQENKKKEGVVALPSGLQYRVLKAGSDGPSPTLFDLVSVHYKGSFIDGRVFDSTHESGKPQVFPVNRVIPGWVEALQLMKVGAQWELIVPHYLAYGEMGFGNEIGPNTTLIFEMELEAIKENSANN